MENKFSQEKPGPSRKSDVIILTPGELAKLGLIPEVIHTSVGNRKEKNKANGGKINEKQKDKPIEDTKCTITNRDKNFKANVASSTISNYEYNKNEKTVPQFKVSNLPPTIDTKSNSNIKLTPCEDKKVSNKSINEIKEETFNFKSDTNDEIKKHTNVNLQSSSKDSDEFKIIQKLKETLKRGLSKKLQECSDNIKCDISSKQNENNTTQKLDKMPCIEKLKNSEIVTNLVDTDKKINITGNSPVCLSDTELKLLVSRTNRYKNSKKSFDPVQTFTESQKNVDQMNILVSRDQEISVKKIDPISINGDGHKEKIQTAEEDNVEKLQISEVELPIYDENRHIEKIDDDTIENSIPTAKSNSNLISQGEIVNPKVNILVNPQINDINAAKNKILEENDNSVLPLEMIEQNDHKMVDVIISDEKKESDLEKHRREDEKRDNANLVTKDVECRVMSNIELSKKNIADQNDHVGNEITQNSENKAQVTSHNLQNPEKRSRNEEEPNRFNELLEGLNKTTVPKKRKYQVKEELNIVNAPTSVTDTVTNIDKHKELDCEQSKNAVHVEIHSKSETAVDLKNQEENKANNPLSVDTKLLNKNGSQKKISNSKDNKLPANAEIPDKNNLEDKCVSNIDIKLPRKRGRPKKISNAGDNKNSISFEGNTSDREKSNELISSVTDAAVEQTTNTTLPKKRGRKKKSEQLALAAVTPVIENIEIERSRSGRKRRKLNYMELAKEVVENEQPEPKRKHKSFTKSVVKADSTKEQNKSDQIENDVPDGTTLTHPELNKTVEDVRDEDNLSIKVEETNQDISTVINDTNSEDTKKVKYRKTGESAKMVNSVFVAAFKNNLTSATEDESKTPGEESSLNIVATTPDKRGRKKKSNVKIDDDNMVTCITCNEKVNNDNWLQHNRQEHNNLSWRDGDQKLRLNNSFEIARILKPILEEDNEIKCKKCKNSFNKARDFSKHMEACSGVLLSNGMVTCAICKTEVEKKKWPSHKQKSHNNLAWRVGDPPLNLNDQHLVITILTALYKSKKPLYCQKCGSSKKSVVGFLSHQSQCGVQIEEAKIKCPFCDKKVLPVSMQTHVKMIHETPKEEKVVENSDYFSVDTDASSTKRKAARTAMLVINKFSGDRTVQEYSKYFLQQLNFSEEDFVKVLLRKELLDNNVVRCRFNNCSYESDTVVNLIEHMNSCEEKPEQYYTCKKCLSISTSEEEVKEHMKSVHSVQIVEDEYDEELEDEIIEQDEMEMKRVSLREKLKHDKDPQYKVKPTFILCFSRRPYQLFSDAYNYTMSFCVQNYSTEGLFRSLRQVKSDWLLLDDKLLDDYLPQYAQSCDIAKRRVNYSSNVLGDDFTFKQFDLFESECSEGIISIFCGGPIQTMAWMPTPYNSTESKQVLAVALLKDFDKKYLVNQHYSDKSVIQFWDFGILKNKQQMTEPTLMFGLAHDFGPVWHVEWCPSGCFDTKVEDENGGMSRMGLLAVAGSDSAVYIYSIPHLTDDQMGLIYKTKPLVKLHVLFNEGSSLSGQKFYATKLSWSKASGHKYVAVGYTDGVVALFDLDMPTLLKCKDKDGCEVLLPFKSFQAHAHAVTVVDLIHLSGGKRWLLTGSFDRNLIVWDLANDFKIVSRRNIISDGLWITNWIAFISVVDESSTRHKSVPTTLASYRDYLYDHINLQSSHSTVNTISESSWLNGLIYGSAAGDITAIFPQQMLHGMDSDKRLKSYIYSFGYTKLINKHQTPVERLAEAERRKQLLIDKSNEQSSTTEDIPAESNVNDQYEPFRYHEASEKYGLVFCDMKMNDYSVYRNKDKKVRYPEGTESSRVNVYPMQAINKVAYNPNSQASLYYATGYQVGLVRVTYMKFLERDNQIK